MPPTIAVTECDHDAFLEEQAVADESGVELRIRQNRTRDELIDTCRDADGLLVQYARIDGDVMDALPRLRAIGRYGVGVDPIDVDAATARGIAVCNVPDYGTEAVSDHAIGLTLAVARGIPRTDRTRGLIGRDQLALMRDTTIVVNTARGGVVDVPALVEALRAGRLGGAGIDTHEDEPLPVDHPLTEFDNVVLTPHLAWYTEESYGELKHRTIENVVEVLAGRDPRNIVNPQALGVGRTALTHDLEDDTAGGAR